MRNSSKPIEEEIPLGQALFLVGETSRGAQMIPELSSFQLDGELFNPEQLDPESLDEELLSSLDRIRGLLNSREGHNR